MPQQESKARQRVPDDRTLWRRIPPIHFPQKEGQERPSSAAFEDNDKGPMSVVVAEDGGDVERVMLGHDGFGLVALSAEYVHSLGLEARYAPLPDEPAHAVVVGNKTASKRRRMAKSSTWIVPPPQRPGT